MEAINCLANPDSDLADAIEWYVMEHTTASPVCVPVPCDDGAIERAFADFESKLLALAEALREAQAAVRGMAARHVDSEAGTPHEQPPYDACADAAVESVEPTPTEPVPASEPTTDVEGAAGTSEALTVGTGGVLSPPAGAEAVGETAADDGFGRAAALPHTAVAETPAPEPRVDEDEALLATLDEETANAIRVMRRMSMGKKSVRELLEKYQASHPSQRTGNKPKKQSWWR